MAHLDLGSIPGLGSTNACDYVGLKGSTTMQAIIQSADSTRNSKQGYKWKRTYVLQFFLKNILSIIPWGKAESNSQNRANSVDDMLSTVVNCIRALVWTRQKHTKVLIYSSKVQCINTSMGFSEVIKRRLKCTTGAGVWISHPTEWGIWIRMTSFPFHHQTCLGPPVQQLSHLTVTEPPCSRKHIK